MAWALKRYLPSSLYLRLFRRQTRRMIELARRPARA
jgi:hypothetical protein